MSGIDDRLYGTIKGWYVHGIKISSFVYLNWFQGFQIWYMDRENEYMLMCSFECNFNVPWFNQLLSWGSICGVYVQGDKFWEVGVIFVKIFNVECLRSLKG